MHLLYCPFFLGATSCDSGQSWHIPDNAGPRFGAVSPDWPRNECRNLLGRCLDLKHAYKQLVRNPQDAWASVLAVLNPHDHQVYFFEAVALPFGSVSSVIAFNRAARALRCILSKLFRLVVTNFFDDFCQLELDLITGSAWKTAEMVMNLLGWTISTGDDKRKPFEKKFEILGAVIALPPPDGGPVTVENKKSRLDQISGQVDELKQHLGKSVSRSLVESLKGRLLYASGHTFGKCTQLACQLLHRFSSAGASVKVSAELVHATSEALSLLVSAGPRRIDCWSNTPPILVFTDGAVEEGANKVIHGALLLDPASQRSLVFGDHVPQKFVHAWMRFGKRQVIAQTEIFPVLVAKETWADVLAGRSVLWFLDNESAKMALIRKFSPILDIFILLQTNAKFDIETQSKNWYSRVPSKSNPSDSASRLEFDEYTSSTRCEPCYAKVTSTFTAFELLLKSLEVGG